MKSKKWIYTLIGTVVFLALAYFLWPYAFTVVPIAQVEQQKISEAFDPVAYVDGIWDSKIIPTINSEAEDLTDILSAMQPDAQGIASKEDLIKVAEQYGLITVGEAHVYLVKGEAQVVSINDETSLGVMEIIPSGYTGPIKVVVYIGPRIPSDETSVRDGVGFITFGDFKEQTEFGKVGAEINKRVLDEAFTNIDKDQLIGKTITFYGAMTIRTFNLVNIDLKKITIVPVKIEIKG
jgi:predicted lipoprotein